LFDRFHGIHKLHKDPDLDHIAGFPIVGSFGEASRDDHSVLILVDYESVAHWEISLGVEGKRNERDRACSRCSKGESETREEIARAFPLWIA